MTIVVDASVAAKWLLVEADTAKARALVTAAEQGGLKLLAPDILAAEIANVLWKRALRGTLTADEARSLYFEFERISPALIKISNLAELALHLAVERRHPVYDCLYVALALETRCPLVTADEGLFRAFSPTLGEVRLLRDWR